MPVQFSIEIAIRPPASRGVATIGTVACIITYTQGYLAEATQAHVIASSKIRSSVYICVNFVRAGSIAKLLFN